MLAMVLLIDWNDEEKVPSMMDKILSMMEKFDSRWEEKEECREEEDWECMIIASVASKALVVSSSSLLTFTLVYSMEYVLHLNRLWQKCSTSDKDMSFMIWIFYEIA